MMIQIKKSEAARIVRLAALACAEVLFEGNAPEAFGDDDGDDLDGYGRRESFGDEGAGSTGLVSYNPDGFRIVRRLHGEGGLEVSVEFSSRYVRGGGRRYSLSLGAPSTDRTFDQHERFAALMATATLAGRAALVLVHDEVDVYRRASAAFGAPMSGPVSS